MKKSNKSITLIVVILCLATLAVAWTSNWFSNWSLPDWSAKWQALFTEQQKDNPGDNPSTPDNPENPNPSTNNQVVAVSGTGEELRVDGKYNMPANFAYVCSESEVNKSVVVIAKISPSDASDKALLWSVSWVDPASEFASGKTVTDYVTISVNPDTTQCTVTYVQDFASQILLKATSLSNSDKVATCTVDCFQKFSATRIGYSGGTADPDINFEGYYYNYNYIPKGEDYRGAMTSTNVKIESSTYYTIANTIQHSTFDLSLLDDVKAAYREMYLPGISNPEAIESFERKIAKVVSIPGIYLEITDQMQNVTDRLVRVNLGILGAMVSDNFLNNYFTYDVPIDRKFVYEYTKKNYVPIFNLKLNIETDYYTKSFDFNVIFDKETWKTPVDKVELDKPGVEV